MILTFVEELQNVWNIISPYLTGITLGGIISCFFYAFFSGSIKKFINKIQIGDMVEKTVNETMEQIKDVAISIDLQPLIETELKKVVNVVDEKIQQAYETNNAKCDAIINCFEKLACYFDNSIGVSQENKEALHNAIDEAKNINKTETIESIDVKPIIVDKKLVKSQKKTTTNVR